MSANNGKVMLHELRKHTIISKFCKRSICVLNAAATCIF